MFGSSRSPTHNRGQVQTQSLYVLVCICVPPPPPRAGQVSSWFEKTQKGKNGSALNAHAIIQQLVNEEYCVCVCVYMCLRCVWSTKRVGVWIQAINPVVAGKPLSLKSITMSSCRMIMRIYIMHMSRARERLESVFFKSPNRPRLGQRKSASDWATLFRQCSHFMK